MVMGLIVIGGGVVFLNCQRGFRSARASSCMSNVKQIAVSLRLYCSDWDRPPQDPRDFGALLPYTKNMQIFVCPAQKEPAGRISTPVLSLEANTRTDYLLNPQMRLDEAPGLVIVGDDQPHRHLGKYWLGARLDGACFLWPESEWQSRLGGVTTHAPPPEP